MLEAGKQYGLSRRQKRRPRLTSEHFDDFRIRRGGNDPNIEALLDATYVKIGERARAEEILESLKSRANSFKSTPIDRAVLYESLDKRDEAFAVLEKAFAERHGELGYMRLNPNYDGLRSDLRFQDLLRRMNLPL